jgi:hypothetical protein
MRGVRRERVLSERRLARERTIRTRILRPERQRRIHREAALELPAKLILAVELNFDLIGLGFFGLDTTGIVHDPR